MAKTAGYKLKQIPESCGLLAKLKEEVEHSIDLASFVSFDAFSALNTGVLEFCVPEGKVFESQMISAIIRSYGNNGFTIHTQKDSDLYVVKRKGEEYWIDVFTERGNSKIYVVDAVK